MKTKDKDLLVNPLADVKPPREGPTFSARLKAAWSNIKVDLSKWAFGSRLGVPLPPPPPTPIELAGGNGPKGSKDQKCPICGTIDCLNRDQMQRLRRKGSLGNSLLRSCEVRRQLKEMEKFRVRTSSGKDVWMTKQGRIERPESPPLHGRTRPPVR